MQLRNSKELLAAEVICYIESNKCSVRTALRKMGDDYFSSQFERSAVYSLVIETIRRFNVVNFIFMSVLRSIFSSPDRFKTSRIINNLFLIGIFRMKFENHPAPLVSNTITQLVINEKPSLNRKLISKICFQIERFNLNRSIHSITNKALRLSLQYWYPEWFIEECFSLFSKKELIIFLESGEKALPTYIRIIPKHSSEETLRILKKEKLEIVGDPLVSDCWRVIKSDVPIPRMTAYREGLIHIQNRASTLVSHVLDPQKGETILDACASPGGKSTHISSLMKGSGEIIAIEKNKERYKRLLNTINRLGTRNITPLQMDALNVAKFHTEFDRILLDPPCSGTGAFAAKPGIKWFGNPQKISKLVKLQSNLLTAVSKVVREGGIIVYSTCSILKRENEGVIRRFLMNSNNFILVKPIPIIGDLISNPLCQQMWPHKHQTDGFSIFKLKRTE